MRPLCHSPNHMQSTSSRGSALLMVLWVVGFLTLLVTTAMLVLRQDVETAASQRTVSRTRCLAEMGLAIAVHPQVKPNDPLLRRKLNATESYEAIVTSEEGRLSLKTLLTEERRSILERIFRQWGLKPLDAESVVDAMMDWVDVDDLKRMKGVEHRDYLEMGLEDRPYNHAFLSLDEVALVAGMEQVEALHPNWRDEFTVFGQGQLDLNEATAERIAVLLNVEPSLAESLVDQRMGLDSLAHTEDDKPLENLEEVLASLGLSGELMQQAVGLVTLKGSTRRIESIGHMGDQERGLVVVFQNGGSGTPRVLEWKEFVPQR
ncbi:hypothetical protein BH11VER1_BH11VER1_23100 [soil metagenome]